MNGGVSETEEENSSFPTFVVQIYFKPFKTLMDAKKSERSFCCPTLNSEGDQEGSSTEKEEWKRNERVESESGTWKTDE